MNTSSKQYLPGYFKRKQGLPAQACGKPFLLAKNKMPLRLRNSPISAGAFFQGGTLPDYLVFAESLRACFSSFSFFMVGRITRKTVPPQATVKIARKLRIFPVFPEDSSSVSSAGSAAEVVVCTAGSAAQVSAVPETARIQRLKKLQSRSLQRMRLRFPMAISPAATAKWVRTKRLRCDPDRRHS